MKKLNFDVLGWMIAATLGGLMIASGFQGAQETFAVVDVQKVMEGSEIYKTKEAAFVKAAQQRQALLKFVADNQVISAEQLPKLRDLFLKETPTDADKADLTKLEADISGATKRLADLQAKSNKTPDDVSILEDYQRRVQLAQGAYQDWSRTFNGEIPNMREEALKAVQDKVRIAAQAVGKAQGYTLVLDTAVAPYANHDITDATLTFVNSNK